MSPGSAKGSRTKGMAPGMGAEKISNSHFPSVGQDSVTQVYLVIGTATFVYIRVCAGSVSVFCSAYMRYRARILRGYARIIRSPRIFESNRFSKGLQQHSFSMSIGPMKLSPYPCLVRLVALLQMLHFFSVQLYVHRVHRLFDLLRSCCTYDRGCHVGFVK